MRNIFAQERRVAVKEVTQSTQLKYNRAFPAYVSSPELIQLNPQDLDNIYREGYAKNAIVRACVDKIANVISTMPIILVQYKDADKWERVHNHPAERLLNRPQGNTEFGKKDLLFAFAADYVNSGFSFMQISSPQRGERANIPNRLYPLRASKIRVVSGTAIKPISHFIYQDQATIEIPTKDALYIRNWNPTDYWFGASQVYAMGHLVDLFNMQVLWNSSLLKNKGVPPYYLYSDSYVTKETAEDISKLAAEMLNGYNNSGRPWVQHSGLKLEKLGFNASDIDWREGMEMIAKLICIGLGIPPSLIGLTGSGSTSRKEDEKSFYLETIIPHTQSFLDAWNNKIMPMFGEEDGDLRFIIDKDQILALREDIDRLHNRSRANYLAGILTRDEARDEIDFQPKGGMVGDRIVEPVNVAQVGDNVASQTEKEKPLSETEKLPNFNG